MSFHINHCRFTFSTSNNINAYRHFNWWTKSDRTEILKVVIKRTLNDNDFFTLELAYASLYSGAINITRQKV